MLKRNPQPGCVFVFPGGFSPVLLGLRNATLYSILFFYFNFIYIRYTYARAHAKGNSRKVAGCGLRFWAASKSATLQPRNPQLCNFRDSRFSGVGVQGFPRFMQNVSSLRGKGGRAARWGSLRLSQVSDDGFHFRLEEGVPAGMVMHGPEFVQQRRTTVYPSVQCFHCALRTGAWQVKQSQFGLAVGTECEHVFRSF